MKAMVFHGPDKKAWEEVPDATIQKPTDVVVKVETTTICGTDLHILKGDVPAVQDGRILGHEGVGTITEVGSAISSLSVGDRVIMSCISACGHCNGVTNPVEDDSFHGRIVRGGAATRSHRDQPVTCAVHD